MIKSVLAKIAAILALANVGLVAAQSSALAHHSFALFDAGKSVDLEGTVKSFEWTNPHSWIRLEVLGPGNTGEEWLIELPSAGLLAREGWNKSFVKPGERISVRISPLKDGRKGGVLQSFAPREQR